jgi:Zn-dependent protease
MLSLHQLTTVQRMIALVPPLLFAITVHEVAHGWLASKLGDKTAKMLGRITLNPIKHIDLVGTIIVPLVLFLFSGFIFGWAKPVPVTWNNLRHPRRDMALVALAGPAANFLMIFIWALIGKIGLILASQDYTWFSALFYMGQAGVLVNALLMILNLVPIPPLDGSRVLASIMPASLAVRYERMEIIGFVLLIILLMTGVLYYLIFPPVDSISRFVSYVFGLPLEF